MRLTAAVVAGAVVLSVAPGGSAAHNRSSASGDVAAAESALAAATQHRIDTEARLASVESEVEALNSELGRLDAGAARITEELAAARRDVREYAIAAYIDGGQAALAASALEVQVGNDMAWGAQLMGAQTSEAGDAVDRFEALKAANEPDRIAAAARLDELTATLADARNDLIQASAHERDAESALARARDHEARLAAEAEQAAEARQAAEESARESAEPPSSGATGSTSSPRQNPQPPRQAPAPVAATDNPTSSEQQKLASIRHCESRGNYSIVSSSGKYRGAYQFDRRTWAGVGGSGDPAAASPAEQDYRALLLYRQRGSRPWPNCG